MMKGPAYRLGSQTGVILRHLANFRKFLSPLSCVLAAVGRPIIARTEAFEKHSVSAVSKAEVPT
jgi:hypothetical protein